MRAFTACLGSFIALIFATAASSQETPPPAIKWAGGEIQAERLATLEFPWGLALLPDGRLLVTEKAGRMRVWQNGKLSEPLKGVPKVFRHDAKDQGGLMDVEADLNFAQNKTIYFSYVEAATQQPSVDQALPDFRFKQGDPKDVTVRGGVVASAKLEGSELRDVKIIWRQEPKTMGRGHFGNRIVTAKDGTLFITSGDRMRFEPAQLLSTSLGKVVRINTDGTNPKDNPFLAKEGMRGDIWSYGHRNLIAAALDPQSQKLWVFEMGPEGGDEVNLIEKGKNYGWPVVGNGDHYPNPNVTNSASMMPGHPKDNEKFQPPVRTWTPVVSPSGAMFYTGDVFKQWKGNVLVGGLSSQAIVRIALDGDRIALEERIDMKRRVRDLLQAPDGSIYLITDDAKGELLRLRPAAKP